MKQYFESYIFWEDYINGMYDAPNKIEEESFISKAIEVLSNTDLFLSTCKEVLKEKMGCFQ